MGCSIRVSYLPLAVGLAALGNGCGPPEDHWISDESMYLTFVSPKPREEPWDEVGDPYGPVELNSLVSLTFSNDVDPDSLMLNSASERQPPYIQLCGPASEAASRTACAQGAGSDGLDHDNKYLILGESERNKLVTDDDFELEAETEYRIQVYDVVTSVDGVPLFRSYVFYFNTARG